MFRGGNLKWSKARLLFKKGKVIFRPIFSRFIVAGGTERHVTRDHSNIVVIFSFPRNNRFRNSHCVYETLKVYSRNAVAMHRKKTGKEKKVSIISGEIDFFELSSFSETFLKSMCNCTRNDYSLSLSPSWVPRSNPSVWRKPEAGRSSSPDYTIYSNKFFGIFVREMGFSALTRNPLTSSMAVSISDSSSASSCLATVLRNKSKMLILKKKQPTFAFWKAAFLFAKSFGIDSLFVPFHFREGVETFELLLSPITVLAITQFLVSFPLGAMT